MTQTSTEESESQQAEAYVMYLAQIYPQLREYNHGCSRLVNGEKVNWFPVSREKAGTELRKLPEFSYVEQADAKLGWFHAGFKFRNYGEELQDADNATIAAARKMEEGK